MKWGRNRLSQTEQAFALWLQGPFRLESRDGERIDVPSKRGQALLAMLATSGAGERTRAWLQDRLWGSRGNDQAQASLRRELSNLRKAINRPDAGLLQADYNRVWLDFKLVRVDLRALDGAVQDSAAPGDLLEGLDVAGEDGFEDWLREERARITARRAPTQVEPSPPGSAAPPLDEFSLRPAIAVLPFVWTPVNPSREAIAEGISDDLIDLLAKLRWLPVIARSSCSAVAGDARSVGLQLGARYIVEGAVRGEEAAAQLSASLTDTENGQVLWSSRMALPAGDDKAGFEALLGVVSATLGLKVDLREQTRAMAKPISDLKVNDLIWRGRWHLNRLTREDSLRARECFDQALALEPASPEALIQVTWVRLWELWVNRGDDAAVRTARQMAQQAIIADYDDARGHMLAGIAEIWLRQPLRAEALLNRAIELNPSLVMAHAQLGCVLHLKGEHRAAITRLGFAMRLSPNDHDLFFTLGELAGAHLFCGEAALALDFSEQALARRSAYWLAHVIKINALVQLGQLRQANAALADLVAAKTGFRAEFIAWMPFLDSAKRETLTDGLNRAAAWSD